MMRWSRRLLLLPVFLLAAYGGYHAWNGWSAWGARDDAASGSGIDAYLRDRVTDSMVKDIRSRRKLETLYIPPIEGDVDDRLRGLLESRIRFLDQVRVEEDLSRVAGIVRDLDGGGGVLERLAALFEPQPETSPGEAGALAPGRRGGVSALLLARVLEWDVQSDRPRLQVATRVLEAGTGRIVVPPRVHSAELSRSLLSLPYLSLAIRDLSPWGRVLVWEVLLLLLPFIAVKGCRAVLSRESNRANALLLVSMTLVDAAAVWILLGFVVDGFLPLVALAAGSGVALAYNHVVLSRLEELRR